MTYHVNSWFNLARQLCSDLDGRSDAVKAALAEAGCTHTARVMSQMRVEGRVTADAEKAKSIRYVRDARAGVMHLVDLKRARHSPSRTELLIAPDGHLSSVCLRTRRLSVMHSLGGSPAAACAEG